MREPNTRRSRCGWGALFSRSEETPTAASAASLELLFGPDGARALVAQFQSCAAR